MMKGEEKCTLLGTLISLIPLTFASRILMLCGE